MKSNTDPEVKIFAQAFMASVFEHIKHGDDEHKAWLKEKCEEMVPTLARRLQRQKMQPSPEIK